MEKAIAEAKRRNVAYPRLIFIYMDDCWCVMSYPRQGLRSTTNNPIDPASDFNDCLNSVHPRVQFTREEEEDGAIAFLDVQVTRGDDGKLTT